MCERDGCGCVSNKKINDNQILNFNEKATQSGRFFLSLLGGLTTWERRGRAGWAALTENLQACQMNYQCQIAHGRILRSSGRNHIQVKNLQASLFIMTFRCGRRQQ